MSEDDSENKRIIIAISDYLRQRSDDLSREDDRYLIQMAIDCLETVYKIESSDYVRFRLPRRLPDIMAQAATAVSAKNRLSSEAFKLRGNEFMASENFEQALEAYTKAIALDRWNPLFFCNRAAARSRLADYRSAVDDCRRAVALDPTYSKAYSRMGLAYASLNDKESATRWCREASDLEPENEVYRSNLRAAEAMENSSTEHSLNDLQSLFAELSSTIGLPSTANPHLHVMGNIVFSHDLNSTNSDEAITGETPSVEPRLATTEETGRTVNTPANQNIPTNETSLKQNITTDETSLKPNITTDETSTSQTVPTDKTSTNQNISTDQTATNQNISTDETATNQSIPTDEPSASQNVRTDETSTNQNAQTDKKTQPKSEEKK